MSLAAENRGLAFHVARRYRSDKPEDVAGEALLGLVVAERDFDPSRGTFSCFAARVIERRLGDFVKRERARPFEAPLFLKKDDDQELERPEAACEPIAVDVVLGGPLR